MPISWLRRRSRACRRATLVLAASAAACARASVPPPAASPPAEARAAPRPPLLPPESEGEAYERGVGHVALPAPSASYAAYASAPGPGRRGLVDLDLKDVDIANVCRLLADVGHSNIVVTDDVHGSVTLRLRGVPWDRALEVILETKGLHVTWNADVIVVRAK